MSTTTTAKQRLVSQIYAVLGKGKQPPHDARPVLEQFIYAVCREGTTREPADKAFRQLQHRFFDWNEVRVSSTRELAEALSGLPHPEARAQRIIDFLQEVFETEFSFDLAALEKKGAKLAAKQLARYQAANDYAVSQVVQHSLGGHAVPLDEPSMRALRRLGLLDGDAGDIEALRASIEQQVPKARAQLFSDLVSLLADDFCHDDEPRCGACPLGKECPTGQDLRAAAAPSARKPR